MITHTMIGDSSPRIVYMGSPDFAVLPLRILLEAGHKVVGVITAPDRPAGRGKKIRRSAIKEYLLKEHEEIPIFQPEKLKDPTFIKELVALKPDLQIVVAFRMLPEVIWGIPAMGTFNLHASLLPQYRGAAPINHAIINGEEETGVSTFFIDEKIDTGEILLQERCSIGVEETAGELHDRLMELGASLVLKTVEQIAEGGILEAKPQEQLHAESSSLKSAPKIFKEDCRLNWTLPGRQVYNLIRGLSPYPGAFTLLPRENATPLSLKIYSASYKAARHKALPGTIISDGKQYMKVLVKDGEIHIHSIQQEGKRKMEIKDFLAGFNFMSAVSRFS